MPRYPRDMIGYGGTSPVAPWPDGALIAVQIVLNYEEGGESNILHGDAASEAFLSEIAGSTPCPFKRHANMESIYEYGARAGFWRLHRLFTAERIPITVYGVATALARSPEQVAAMLSANWEIASHGLKWIDYKDYSTKDEKADIQAAIALHQQVTGSKPQGWYTGRCSNNTIDLVAQEGICTYQSDSYADDLPYWRETPSGAQLMVPYTLDANDMRFATQPGFSTGDEFFTYLKDSFDALYEEGQAGAPKMMSIGLHCRLIGRPGRIQSLKAFIAYAKKHPKVWFARRIDIANRWLERYPSVALEIPSKMDEARFVAVFGAVFEHSAWIAQETFNTVELGAAFDTTVGLHAALCRCFRAASHERQLCVLRSHPDLAGILPKSNKLTDASSAEQESAGLGWLTDAQQHSFRKHNAAYKATFGHPFIIAVKGLNAVQILEIFERRLQHSSAEEFAEACRQVEKIALLRLAAKMPRSPSTARSGR